jgi:octaprenyl-diphosphate synthase
VEWLHTATLVHDDVLDEADIRRGQPTVRQRWGNRLAVWMGDYAYFHTVHTLTHECSTALADALLHACERMALGEVLQSVERHAGGLRSEAVYLRIAEYKTGTLLAATCQAGGLLAGASEPICRSLYDYGLALGLGFQLKDDAMDYLAAPRSRKPPGQGLLQGVVTLPLLHLLSKCDRAECREIEAMLRSTIRHQTMFEGVQALLKGYGSLDYTLACVHEYGTLAKERLELITESPYRHAMAGIVDRLLTVGHV